MTWCSNMGVSSLIWVSMSDMGWSTWRWWGCRVGVVGGDVRRVGRVGGGSWGEEVVRVLRVRRVVGRVHHLTNLQLHEFLGHCNIYNMDNSSKSPSVVPPHWHCKWALSLRSPWRTSAGLQMAALAVGPENSGRSENCLYNMTDQVLILTNFQRWVLKRQVWYFVTSVPRHKTGNLPNDLQLVISRWREEKIENIREAQKWIGAPHSTGLSVQIHFCKEKLWPGRGSIFCWNCLCIY